jgi:hypothetical protein
MSSLADEEVLVVVVDSADVSVLVDEAAGVTEAVDVDVVELSALVAVDAEVVEDPLVLAEVSATVELDELESAGVLVLDEVVVLSADAVDVEVLLDDEASAGVLVVSEAAFVDEVSAEVLEVELLESVGVVLDDDDEVSA